jgi:Ca2+-binding RTX toxin-like protein
LAFPPGAAAAQAARLLGTNDLAFSAAPNEVNDLTVALEGGDHTFEDAGASVTPGSDCFFVTTNKVRCPAQPGDSILVLVRDEDDQVTATSPVVIAECGGIGDDELEAGPGGGTLIGEEDDDTLTGGAGFDLLLGEGDCDGVQTGQPAGQNVLEGGGGNDIVEGGERIDTLSGGQGDDSLFGFGGDDALEGGEGRDSLTGYAGDDLLSGGEGDDFLGGASGDDDLAGGPGDDRLGVTYVRNDIVFVDTGDDLLEGGEGDDLLTAGPGSGFLNFGLQGGVEAFDSDVPNGGDDLRGGPGRDTASYAKFSAGVTVSQDEAANDGAFGEGDNVRSDVEVVQGGAGDDTLLGTAGSDDLDGSAGSDELYGGGGDDSLAGGAEDGGADTLEGGDGSDSLRGGAGGDTLRGQAGRDTIGGGGGSDTLSGGEDNDALSGGTGLDTLSGGPGDDALDGAEAIIVGADGADRLEGGPGADDLRGGPGEDSLAGGRGADALAGGDGVDRADYRAARRAIEVTFDDAANDGEPGEGDNVRSDVEGASGSGGPDDITGNGLANPLAGGAGEDFVEGARGSDDLRGGGANDTLRARDGTRDRVACGPGLLDLAIVDAADRVLPGCELVDRGDGAPLLGRAAVLRPARASPRLKLPGTERFVPLEDRLRVPFGAVVDAAAGTVRVGATGSARARRARRAATVSGGRFRIAQRRRRGAVAELRLDGPAAACPRRAGRRALRSLLVSSRAGFQTRGRHALARGRGAHWLTRERCDGTLVSVRRGTVRVVDLRSSRRLTLRAGRTYLARKTGR